MGDLIVVIPAYNAEKYLREAVASVLRQPCNCSVVIVNDGSTDGTGAICDIIASEDSRVKILHQENSGVSCARNRGISYALEHNEDATGYIGFCDADDLWKAGCVTQQILNEAADQKADIIGFSCWCTDQEAQHYYVNNQYQENTVILPEKGTVEWMLKGPFCAHLYSIKMIREFTLRFPENVARNEDVIFMRQAVFSASRIAYREETLYLYRTNRSSVTHQSTDVTGTMLDTCRAWYGMRFWTGTIVPLSHKQDDWRHLCLFTAAAVLLEAARKMAEQGLRRKHILNIIKKEPYFAEIDNLIVENLAYWQQPDLIMFREDFGQFYWKHRIRGMVKTVGKLALCIPMIRNRRDRKRFPFEVKDDYLGKV